MEVFLVAPPINEARLLLVFVVPLQNLIILVGLVAGPGLSIENNIMSCTFFMTVGTVHEHAVGVWDQKIRFSAKLQREFLTLYDLRLCQLLLLPLAILIFFVVF